MVTTLKAAPIAVAPILTLAPAITTTTTILRQFPCNFLPLGARPPTRTSARTMTPIGQETRPLLTCETSLRENSLREIKLGRIKEIFEMAEPFKNPTPL
jgi:hypothetical protein